MDQETEWTDAVVHADKNDTFLRQLGAVVHRDRARALVESTAVDPEHHRKLRGRGLCRSPDVQEEAVFADRTLRHELLSPWEARPGLVLHTARAEMVRLAHTVPMRGRLRRPPAKVTGGGGGIGDAEVGGYG